MNSMHGRLLSLAGVFAGLAVFSAPAHAATMKAVYKGTVISGEDRTNELGLGTNVDLQGYDFTATFVYDPSTVGALFNSTGDASGASEQVYGGTSQGVPSPMFGASIAIGAGGYAVDSSYYGYIINQQSYADTKSQANHQAQYISSERGYDAEGNYFENREDDFIFMYFVKYLLSIPVDLDAAYSVALADGEFGGDRFQAFEQHYTCQNGDSDCALNVARYAFASLNPTSLTVSRLDTPAVPLPPALPLLATALAGAGLLGWRRRRAAA